MQEEKTGNVDVANLPEPGRPQATERVEDFGSWLSDDNTPPDRPKQAPSQPTSAVAKAPPDPSETTQWTLWAHRAGKGPLASVVQAPGAVAPESHPPGERPFVSVDRPAIMTILFLASLVVAGAYALHCDTRWLPALEDLRQHNESIRSYNRSRNVIVQHLARQQAGRRSRLKQYAGLFDGGRQKGSIRIIGPDGQAIGQPAAAAPQAAPVAVGAAADWAPPLPLASYDSVRFETSELLASRLPMAMALLCALVCLMLWSYCAYQNLEPLQAGATSFRPWGVLVCWLIPLANVFLPCAVIGEVWHGSDPRKFRRPGGFRLPVVGFWWLLMLAGVTVIAIAAYRVTTATGIEEMVGATEFALHGDAAAIVIGVLTVALVAAASWNQNRRHQLVERAIECLGPPRAWHEPEEHVLV